MESSNVFLFGEKTSQVGKYTLVLNNELHFDAATRDFFPPLQMVEVSICNESRHKCHCFCLGNEKS